MTVCGCFRNLFFHVNIIACFKCGKLERCGAFMYAGSKVNAELEIIASSHKVIKEITSMILHLMRRIYGFMAVKVSIHL